MWSVFSFVVVMWRGWFELFIVVSWLMYVNFFNNNVLNVFDCLVEKGFIVKCCVGYCFNLRGEIGVMLCGGLNYED